MLTPSSSFCLGGGELSVTWLMVMLVLDSELGSTIFLLSLHIIVYTPIYYRDSVSTPTLVAGCCGEYRYSFVDAFVRFTSGLLPFRSFIGRRTEPQHATRNRQHKEPRMNHNAAKTIYLHTLYII